MKLCISLLPPTGLSAGGSSTLDLRNPPATTISTPTAKICCLLRFFIALSLRSAGEHQDTDDPFICVFIKKLTDNVSFQLFPTQPGLLYTSWAMKAQFYFAYRYQVIMLGKDGALSWPTCLGAPAQEHWKAAQDAVHSILHSSKSPHKNLRTYII